MRLVNIGFGNMVCIDRVIAIVVPESAPIKRIVSESKDRGLCIDATYGRKTRTVLITDTDHVILSALQPDTIKRRAAGASDDKREPDVFEDENDAEAEDVTAETCIETDGETDGGDD